MNDKEKLEDYIKTLAHQGIIIRDAKGHFISRRLKFCTLHYDAQMQHFDIALDRQFPYLTPFKAVNMGNELLNVAEICDKLNKLT